MYPYKLSIISILFFLFSFSTLGQVKKYDLKFKIKNIKDSVAYLGYYYGKKVYIRDTAKVVDETIHFKSDKEYPKGICLFLFQDLKNYFEFIFNDEKVEIHTATETLIESMEVIHSKENKIFYKHIKESHPLLQEIKLLTKEINTPNADSINWKINRINEIKKTLQEKKNEFIEKYPDNYLTGLLKITKPINIPEEIKDEVKRLDYLRKNFFSRVDFSDDRLIYSPVLKEKTDNYIKNLYLPIPDSTNFALDMILEKAKENKKIFNFLLSSYVSEYERNKVMGIDAVFVHLVEKYMRPNKEKIDWLTAKQLEAVLGKSEKLGKITINKKAIDILGADIDKNPKKLYDTNYKFTLLLFWDVNCGNCKKELPKFKEIYEKFHSKNFGIYAMSTGWTEKWVEYMKENTYPWINVGPTETNVFEHYQVNSTPTTFLLDEDKKIIAKGINAEVIEKILTQLYSVAKDTIKN